jgi:FKBP-type peptidyl-prolyl cis-trans isomerase
LIDATVVEEVAEPEPEDVAVELDSSRFGFVVYDAGSGDKVGRGQKVKVDYVGTFLTGVEFDSSRDRGPFEFVVGQGNAIKCWDFALLQLNVGDKAKLNCPANTAYGERGNPSIPGGATIQFDIHVISQEVDEATQE